MIDAALVLGIIMLGFWMLSIPLGKVSYIDSLWGLGFVIYAWAAAYFATEASFDLALLSSGQQIILALVSLWGLRLSLYLIRRFLSEGEDKRYVRMTAGKEGVARHFFTLWFVFGFQTLLILIIGAPVVRAILGDPIVLGPLAYFGIALWGIGAFFEWVGDWQLSQFKKDPANEGAVMDKGLWAYTRHPNYFGDACVWWGLWFISGDLYTLFAPVIMTYLLANWSGKPLLEAGLKKRRPGYVDYIERTSGFIPMPPKKRADAHPAEG